MPEVNERSFIKYYLIRPQAEPLAVIGEGCDLAGFPAVAVRNCDSLGNPIYPARGNAAILSSEVVTDKLATGIWRRSKSLPTWN